MPPRRPPAGPGTPSDLAVAATVAYRFPGTFTRLPSVDEVTAVLTEAQRLARDGDPAAEAAVALAEAAVIADAFGAVQGNSDHTAQETVARAERAVEAARRAGDPVAESAALDALSGARSWAGDAFAAAAAARRRVDVLTSVPRTPAGTHELVDAPAMAADAALERVAPEPDRVWKWVSWVWLHWYVALRAEALLDGDPTRQPAAAAAFDAAGCRYQSARTLLLAGDGHAAAGTAALADLGLAPMTVGWRRPKAPGQRGPAAPARAPGRCPGARHQPTARLTRAAIRSSTSSVTSVRAKAVAHIGPSSSLAESLNPSVA
ncbi:hypothetical protein GCM10010405_13710 [Streptomyces macrosporus]|uniref:Uncharacterized protein n=1 Tax=Streptomyces macrosporus TaxID=44032 RepID=A0ABN3JJY1_9ACTN